MRALEFLTDYFGTNENFIIAQKYPKIDGKIKHHHTMLSVASENLEKHLGRFYYLNKDKDVDIYFSLNTYSPQNKRYPSRKEKFVESIKSFYFDIDKGDVEKKKSEIINLIGEPTYIIESSKDKFQFIYKFSKPYLVRDENSRDYFKQLLKGLIYHFDVDKTFDTARIFRLVGYMNKKPKNDNFIVGVKKYNNLYSFEEFEKIAKPYLLTDSSKKPLLNRQKVGSTVDNKRNDSHNPTEQKYSSHSGISKIINRKYKELLKRYNNDKSTADLAYVKWLRHSRNITDENLLIKKIFEARGYDELMEKHGYQIEYYFKNILDKSL